MDHHIPATPEALQAFLDQTTDPNLPTFDEVRGFVFAVANAPALIPPNRWLHLAFNGKLPEFRDDDEAKAAIGGMMRLYNNASTQAVGVRDKAPKCRNEPLSNFEDDAPIAHWSRGFDRGQTFVEEQWELPLSTTQLEAFDSISMMLTCFASKELTAIACDQLDDEPITLEELARLATEGFDEAIDEFAQLGRTVFKSVTVRATPGTPVIPATKVGRNDLCPCGSGNKYKRCCGRPS